MLVASTTLPGPVRADGCFVWRNEKLDIREPEQKALIYFHDGIEDLVLSVRFEGAPEEFGWIVPLPAAPTLFPENASIFEYLSKATQARQYRRSEAGARLHQTLGAEGVEVLRADTVGIYRAEILKAAGGEALEAWLRERDYKLLPGAGGVLSGYTRKGWVFATLRILTGAADSLNAARLTDGTIQPVRFRFAATEPIFPLEISSLGGQASDILLYVLAPEVLVPRVPAGDFWDSRVFSTPGEQHWIYQYEQDTGLERFLPDYQEPYRLTKHRARFAPAQMSDITFAPFDPAPRLRHRDSGVRREAVTHLGLLRPPGADTLLASFLETADQGAEAYGTLWALGEIGGEHAEAALLRRADDPDPETRLEALAALGQMGSRRAVPFFIRGLTATDVDPNSGPGYVDATIRYLSFENLVRLGDAGCAASLQSLADSHSGRSAWMDSARASVRDNWTLWWGRASNLDPGGLALAVLATLDQGEAFRTLVEAIVLGGHVTSHDELQTAAATGGSTNNFPSGFWTGLVLQHSSLGDGHWPAFDRTERLFSFAPELRDPLYRICAADPRMPAAGAVVLLGCLKMPQEADFSRLREIWTEALRPPVQTIDVCDIQSAPRHAPRSDGRAAPGAARAGDSDPTIRFNYVACAVAYALSRHDRTDDLRHLYQTAPVDDAVLRGEIVFAMAHQHDPSFQEEVFGYVRDVWNTAAANEGFRIWLRGLEERSTARGERAIFIPDPPLDLPHRVKRILGYVLDGTLNGAPAAALLTDRSLNPYLRVVLLSQVPFGGGWTVSSLSVLQTEVKHLAQVEGARDPLLRRLAEPQIAAFEGRVAWASSHPR